MLISSLLTEQNHSIESSCIGLILLLAHTAAQFDLL